ncbi:calcium-binding protein [Sulfitobacter sp. EhC04]|uniref:calcium-binding protein n=1 Tax=Sulfitobacter sp. EhC04 TaxID=1849168 RepID=UPI0009ED5627|nr:calcium-binding protein [Sulfitobacter sp. EhC04]
MPPFTDVRTAGYSLSIDGIGMQSLYGGQGNDTLTAAVSDIGQIHLRGDIGDDLFNLDLQNDFGRQGHHVYGGEGADIFNFTNIHLVNAPVVGRINDFEPTRDVIMIEGRTINLNALPTSVMLPDGSTVVVRIVAFTSSGEQHSAAELGLGAQQFLQIGDNVFYALDGARHGGNELHFVNVPTAEELTEVAYHNEINFVPFDHYDGLHLRIRNVVHSDDGFHGFETSEYIRGSVQGLAHAGTGADEVIHANGGDDAVDGATGNDTIFGGTGNDSIAGGLDADLIFGEDGDDHLWGGDDHDVLRAGVGNDFLDGGSGNDFLEGWGGFDTIYGGDGNDIIEGGTNADSLFGGTGEDTLSGGAGLDRLWGDAGADRLSGGDDSDYLSGGEGNDTLFGDIGNDFLEGDAGDDRLLGGAGFDILRGGQGNDVLMGNFNADCFVFVDGDGNDTVEDFEATNPFETIDLSGVSEITDFADLLGNHMVQQGDNVVITAGVGQQITLLSVALADLDAGDFVF